jgi:hypothetical protein
MNKPLVKLWKSPRKDFESPTGGFFTRDEYLWKREKKLAEVKKSYSKWLY